MLTLIALGFLMQSPLDELDSSDLAVARRAFEAAVRGGDEKALEEAAKTSERARQALAEVRAHKRFGSCYPEVKTISIELKDEPFASALDKFSKTAGVAILPYSPSGGAFKTNDSVSLNLANDYLLEGMDKFARAAGITIYAVPEGWRYTARAMGSPKILSHARHLALSLRSIREERSANALGQSKSAAYLDFAGRSDGEIRIAAHGQFRFLEVTDATGDSLLPETFEKRPPTGSWSASTGFATGSYIKTPSGDCGELKRVRGLLEILVPEDPRFEELDLAGVAKEVTANNIRFRLDQVLDGGEALKVVCRIPEPQKPHARPIPADFALKSKDGRLVEGTGTVSGAQDAPEANLKFTLPAGFVPASLRLRHFATYGSIEIPFEFRDVRIR